MPTGQPSGEPTCVPTGQPSGEPTCVPTGQPSGEPTCVPSGQPSGQPLLEFSNAQEHFVVGSNVVITCGVLAILSIVSIFIAAYSDISIESKVVPMSTRVDEVSQASSVSSVDIESGDVGAVSGAKEEFDFDSPETILDDALPIGMRANPFLTKFCDVLFAYHKHLSVTTYSKVFPRTWKILSLITSFITMMSFLAILSSHVQSNDGSCELLGDTVDNCLSQPAAFNAGEPKCYWTEGSADGTESCRYLSPSDNFKVLAHISFFAIILTVLFSLFIARIFLGVLAARTSDVKFDIWAIFDHAFKGVVSLENEILGSTVNDDYNNFLQELIIYRNEPTTNVVEFDNLWGFDVNTGHLLSGDANDAIDERGFILKVLINMGLFKDTKNADVYGLIIADIKSSRQKASREILALLDGAATDEEIGRTLIRLLQQDRMPGLSGKITDISNSAPFQPAVPYWQKALGWSTIIGLNAVFLFYLYLFAMHGDKNKQDVWFKSFIMCLVSDILLVATTIVYIRNIWIPSFAMKDVDETREKLSGVIKGDEKPDGRVNAVGGDAFDASKYFNVSTRVAEKFPGLKESALISKFKTPFPLHSYKHIKDHVNNYDTIWEALVGGSVMILTFVLTNFVEIPELMQDFIIQIFIICAYKGLIMIFITLYSYDPLLVLVPILVVIFLIKTLAQPAASKLPISICEESDERIVISEESDESVVGVRETLSQSPNRVASNRRDRQPWEMDERDSLDMYNDEINFAAENAELVKSDMNTGYENDIALSSQSSLHFSSYNSMYEEDIENNVHISIDWGSEDEENSEAYDYSICDSEDFSSKAEDDYNVYDEAHNSEDDLLSSGTVSLSSNNNLILL